MTQPTPSTPAPSTPTAPDAECVALTRTLRRRGTVVLSVFALVWAFAGASGLTSPALALTIETAAVPLAVAAVLLAYRKGAAPSPRVVSLPRNWARSVGVVNVVELAAVFAAVAVSNASGHPGFVPPAVALVVGLHFFPLARLYDQWQYRVTAGVLSAVAVVGLALAAAGLPDGGVQAVVGLAAAATLWASAYHVAVRG
ncbi:hypothetical protein ACFYY2_04900 [Streptomyces sp. NPDC001822]|uniref:hypothetical protein n=1 Tax=Streptomyces sp. NPDC001822 TaxID=3364614 RepID=UPI0036B60D54